MSKYQSTSRGRRPRRRLTAFGICGLAFAVAIPWSVGLADVSDDVPDEIDGEPDIELPVHQGNGEHTARGYLPMGEASRYDHAYLHLSGLADASPDSAVAGQIHEFVRQALWARATIVGHVAGIDHSAFPWLTADVQVQTVLSGRGTVEGGTALTVRYPASEVGDVVYLDRPKVELGSEIVANVRPTVDDDLWEFVPGTRVYPVSDGVVEGVAGATQITVEDLIAALRVESK